MDVRIEFEQSDPPVGRLRAVDGSERPFSGWLGLMGEIAALLRQAEADAEAERRHGDRTDRGL